MPPKLARPPLRVQNPDNDSSGSDEGSEYEFNTSLKTNGALLSPSTNTWLRELVIQTPISPNPHGSSPNATNGYSNGYGTHIGSGNGGYAYSSSSTRSSPAPDTTPPPMTPQLHQAGSLPKQSNIHFYPAAGHDRRPSDSRPAPVSLAQTIFILFLTAS